MIYELEKIRALRRQSKHLCPFYIKNSLSNCLYDPYISVIDPKVLWKALELKYKTYEPVSNEYLMFEYLEFHMVEDIPILEPVQKLQVLLKKWNSISFALPKLFQVYTIIAKLSPS